MRGLYMENKSNYEKTIEILKDKYVFYICEGGIQMKNYEKWLSF